MFVIAKTSGCGKRGKSFVPSKEDRNDIHLTRFNKKFDFLKLIAGVKHQSQKSLRETSAVKDN